MPPASASSAIARPVITGLGAWGSACRGIDALAAALRADRPARFDTHANARGGAVACVALADPDPAIEQWQASLSEAPARALQRTLRRAPSAARASLLAAREAWARAGLSPHPHDAARCALVAAAQQAGTGVMLDAQARFDAGSGLVDPALMVIGQDSYALSLVAEVLGLRGEGAVVGAAQASGLAALIQAARLIASGEADRVLVLGVPTPLADIEIEAYRVLGALAGREADGSPACRPFDADSTGFVPAAIAAAIVLERADIAAARGGHVLARLAGWSSRLHASTLPAPDVDAEAAVMRGAITMAGLVPAQVALVSAHATGTPLGDRAEAEAIARVFGDAPLVNAPKGLFGHALPAAGVFETVCCVEQMRAGHAHANWGLAAPQLRGPRYVPPGGAAGALPAVVKNAFGFGGFNAAVALTAN